jgi:hypothetical protein
MNRDRGRLEAPPLPPYRTYASVFGGSVNYAVCRARGKEAECGNEGVWERNHQSGTLRLSNAIHSGARCHDTGGLRFRDDSVVANGHTRKDRRRTTDPDIGTKTNWRNPGWTRRLCGMVVRVENSRQVPDQAIVTDSDTVTSHDSCTSVDEDTLAEHKGAILGSAHLDWYRLTAQEQASDDRPGFAARARRPRDLRTGA